MIRDADGNELTYWPVTGLRAGEDSPTLNIFVDTPQANRLRASVHEHLTIWGRPAGLGGPYTDLTNTGLDLHLLAGPETGFEIYAHASTAVTTVERVALTVGTISGGPADWFG